MTRLINVSDYEQKAREILPTPVYDYFAGGAADEITLRGNASAWSRLLIVPRVLRDTGEGGLATTILGRPASFPLMLAPCAFNTLAHPDGELAVARAAARAGIIQIVSTLSSFALEEVAAAASGPRWFQLYAYRDQELTRSLVERCAAAGYSALCVTVDVPRLGQRERDLRNQFALPAGIQAANLGHALPSSGAESALATYLHSELARTLTWDTLDWIRELSPLPLVVKGILAAEDAVMAVEHGAAGIVVSNHGGRQLDGAISTVEALGPIASAVAGRAEIFVDGGIRRGSDVLKALALGARAAIVGRPYLWGLAVGGESGVFDVIEQLRAELELCMTLSGCPDVHSARDIIVRFDGVAT